MRDVANSEVAGGAKRGVGKTKSMVLTRFKAGLSVREIALGCGISTQAVHQHIQKLRADGLLPEEDA